MDTVGCLRAKLTGIFLYHFLLKMSSLQETQHTIKIKIHLTIVLELWLSTFLLQKGR